MNLTIFKIFIYLFLFFGCAESSLHTGFSLVAASGEHTLVAVHGSLTVVASLAEHGSRCRGSVVAACGLQSSGSVVVVHWLSCSEAAGSSQTMDATHVPCTGRGFSTPGLPVKS